MINQKNTSTNQQATEKDASVKPIQKADNPKMFWAKWAALLSLAVVVVWWLKAMWQWFGDEVQLEIQDTSTLQRDFTRLTLFSNFFLPLPSTEESFSQLFGWYSLAGVAATVTVLLLAKLCKKKISKPTKPIHCQTVVRPNDEETMTALKEELEQLKERIKEVDICKSEATITWEIKGVDALLTGGSKKKPQSEIFYCRGEFQRNFLDVTSHYMNFHLIDQNLQELLGSSVPVVLLRTTWIT